MVHTGVDIWACCNAVEDCPLDTEVDGSVVEEDMVVHDAIEIVFQLGAEDEEVVARGVPAHCSTVFLEAVSLMARLEKHCRRYLACRLECNEACLVAVLEDH